MATNTTAIISFTNSWAQQSTNSTNTQNQASDAGILTYSRSYVTGVSGVSELYHDLQTLSSGGSNSYDLTALSQSILDYAVTKSFSNIKVLQVKNVSTTSGYDINIGVNSASGFNEPFGYATGLVSLAAGGCLYIDSPYNGYTVDANNKEIVINDGGSGAQYEMVLLGN